jgi:hypothetical protein
MVFFVLVGVNFGFVVYSMMEIIILKPLKRYCTRKKVASDRARKWKALEVETLDNRLTHNLSYDSIMKFNKKKKHAMLRYDPNELPYLQPPKRSNKLE